MPRKVTDPSKVVTDAVVRAHLAGEGIDSDYVEFYKDYSKKFPRSKLYRDRRSGKFIVAISGLDRFNWFGHRMDPRWYVNRHGMFVGGANHLIARVGKDGLSDVWDGKGKHVSWRPRVFLDGVEHKASKAVLLDVDPTNENYHENTIEWDYGICKRRLRLIEGIVSELFVFDQNPGGGVRIESNSRGDLPPRGYFAVDGNGDSLPGFVADSKQKTVLAEDFNAAVYPVVVDDSYTGYSISTDGYLEYYKSSATSRSAVINATSATSKNDSSSTIYITNIYYADERLKRGYLFFDTSSLSGATIESVTLSLYSRYSDTDSARVYKANGSYPHNPLSYSDFYYGHYSTIVGTHPRSGVGYHSNSLDVSVIEPSVTRMFLRSTAEAGGSASQKSIRIYSYDRGSGYQPKLVVTYSVSSVPSVTTQLASLIGTGQATGNGNITDDGGEPITAHGVVWKAGADPVNLAGSDGSTDEGAGVVGAFTSVMSPLSSGTVYYYRAYATNSVGSSYGGAVDFVTFYDKSLAINVSASTGASRSIRKRFGLSVSVVSGAGRCAIKRVASAVSVVSGAGRFVVKRVASAVSVLCSTGYMEVFRKAVAVSVSAAGSAGRVIVKGVVVPVSACVAVVRSVVVGVSAAVTVVGPVGKSVGVRVSGGVRVVGGFAASVLKGVAASVDVNGFVGRAVGRYVSTGIRVVSFAGRSVVVMLSSGIGVVSSVGKIVIVSVAGYVRSVGRFSRSVVKEVSSSVAVSSVVGRVVAKSISVAVSVTASVSRFILTVISGVLHLGNRIATLSLGDREKDIGLGGRIIAQFFGRRDGDTKLGNRKDDLKK